MQTDRQTTRRGRPRLIWRVYYFEQHLSGIHCIHCPIQMEKNRPQCVRAVHLSSGQVGAHLFFFFFSLVHQNQTEWNADRQTVHVASCPLLVFCLLFSSSSSTFLPFLFCISSALPPTNRPFSFSRFASSSAVNQLLFHSYLDSWLSSLSINNTAR